MIAKIGLHCPVPQRVCLTTDCYLQTTWNILKEETVFEAPLPRVIRQPLLSHVQGVGFLSNQLGQCAETSSCAIPHKVEALGARVTDWALSLDLYDFTDIKLLLIGLSDFRELCE